MHEPPAESTPLPYRTMVIPKLMISTHQLSPLEKLPTEILEKIFFEDIKKNNFSLPKASHIIGLKLSGKSTLRKVIIDAFGPCWLLWYGVKTTQAWYWSIMGRTWLDVQNLTQAWGGDYVHERGWRPGEGGDMDWQSVVLNQPWASLPLVLESKEIWIRKHAPRRQKISYGDSQPSKSKHAIPYNDSQFFDAYVEEASDENNSKVRFNVTDCIARQTTSLSEHEHLAKEFARFESLVETNCPSYLFESSEFTLQDYFGISIEIKRGVDIPDRILVGLWTEENTKYLFWLIRSGARSTRDYPWRHGQRYKDGSSDCGWLAYEGWKNAVKAGNLVVLTLMAMLIEKRDWEKVIDSSGLLWAVKHAGGNRMLTIEFVLHIASNKRTRTKFLRELDDPVRQEGLDEDEKKFRQTMKEGIPVLKKITEKDKPKLAEKLGKKGDR